MDMNYDVITFISKYLYLRRARAANLDDFTKIAIIFIKTTSKRLIKKKSLPVFLDAT